MSNQELPRDEFSTALRGLSDNPGAIRTSSKVDLTDFMGNSETWIIDTFRVDGAETILLQRINATGGIRLVLPPAVASAMARQRGSATKTSRKRGARQAIETRKAKGLPIGNPEALRKARRARKK